ncbi:sugar-transfer associated ATP-grasp domain-containing protein [Haloferacaceae archaeon DSL9]
MMYFRLSEDLKKSYYNKKERLIGKPIRQLKTTVRVCETEVGTWSTWISLPTKERLKLWKDGFLSQAALVYDFDKYSSDDYVNAYERRKARYINDGWIEALNNKLLFHFLLEPFDEYRTEVHGFLHQGQIRHRDRNNTYDLTGIEWLKSMLREGNRLVLKPAVGSGGSGVLVCAWSKGPVVNGDQLSGVEFDALISDLDEYIISEYVNQAPYANSFFSDAVNTIRILTFMDEKSGEAFIPIAIHRIGTEKSAPVDNWSAGGLSAEVDVETGVLSAGAMYPFSETVEWYESHPDTNTQIAGESIPNWDLIRNTILEIATEYSHIPYIGWDIVPTSDGFKIIEANYCTDVDLLQVHRPLLVDNRTHKFYRYHGIVK